MTKAVLWIAALMFYAFNLPAHAYELRHSGRTEIVDNPFIAFGYNPKTKITTGYLAALRTAPGRTDECKLVFSGSPGKPNEFVVNYLQENVSSEISSGRDNRVFLVVEKNTLHLKFFKRNIEGDCDWILPWVVESELSENQDELMVEIKSRNVGNWISVYAVSAEKARFYSRPDLSSARKAFLVKGNVIYVYEEQPGWCFVKYGEGKKKAEGWIKMSDTLRP